MARAGLSDLPQLPLLQLFPTALSVSDFSYFCNYAAARRPSMHALSGTLIAERVFWSTGSS